MSKKTHASESLPAPASYGIAIHQIDQLGAGLESGSLPQEDQASYCRRDRLQGVEEQARLLEDGVVKPWTPE